MHLKEHIIASSIASAGIYAATRSVKMTAVSFAAGVLLDLDHFVDYWKENSFNLDMRQFFKACHECNLTKTRLFLHSAELIVLSAAAAYFTRSGIITALTLGACQHLALDQLTNKIYPASYLLTYRWSKGFRAEAVFTNKPWEQSENLRK